MDAVPGTGAEHGTHGVHRVRSRRPVVLRTVALAAAAAAVTGACAAGQLAQTAYEQPSIDGTNRTVGPIDLRAIALEPPAEGETSYAKGSSAPVTLVIVNNDRSADTLTGVTSAAAQGWGAYQDKEAALSPSSEVPLPSFSDNETGVIGASPSSASSSTSSAPEGGTQSVRILPARRAAFGVPGSDATILLTGLKRTLYPGSSIKITFTFAQAGSVTATVPVQVTAPPESPAVVPGHGGEGGEGEGGE